ncbi:MAG TPA: hypothetical protein VN841_22465 [Bryobacteraceae bacterium]|nr:hypothetical protein [Bryobacteraceae bacterium]
MASKTIGDVVTAAVGPLRSAGGSGAGASSGLTDQFTQLTEQLQQLQTVNQAAAQATQDNTQAISLNSTVRAQGGSSTAGTVGGVLENVLGIGTGLSPLITGLMSLFGGGGGGSAQQSPLATLIMPPKTNVNAGISEAAPTQPFGVDYSQGGQPRPVSTSNSGAGGAGSGPQITVQVQALDSQSFLDHSTDIAMAVRQAMLESNVLNDVIQGL